MDNQILVSFAAYFLIILLIGVISYKKQKNDSDFIVGNRSLNFWVIALSAHASDMSSWLFMGFPAAIMIGGLHNWWIALGLIVGMLLNWQFVAKKLREQTEQLNCYTLSTFFEKRFNDNSGLTRILTALMTVVFLSCYLSAGLIGMGLLLESIFGINYYTGLILSTIVVALYTFVGGFITVAWTDLFQAIFLLFMIILVPLIAFSSLPNGFESITTAAALKDISLNWIQNSSFESLLAIVCLVFGWGLGYFGQPHIVTKFMGIRNPNDIYKSKYLGMAWMLVALGGAIAVGFIGIAFFPEGLNNPELIFIQMVKSLFNPLTAGFILCGVLAAGMSTMDSQILVCASVLCEDLYKQIINRKASPSELLMASRIFVLCVSGVALIIALNRNSTVLETVHYAWSGLGCAFGPLVFAALYSSHTNKYGAITGILAGSTIAATWNLLNPYIMSYTIPAMIPGFILSSAVIWIVSRLTKNLRSNQEPFANTFTS
jgi:sodium/proline symporter